MSFSGSGDLMQIDHQARHLAELHGTDVPHERARQARERGHVDWEGLIESQPPHLRDAFRLRDEWLRQPTIEDGDVGGWSLVPALNPIVEDRLPTNPEARAARILAIATLLVWTTNPIGSPRAIDEDHPCQLAAAVIRWEIADAGLSERRPTLAGCERTMRTIDERFRRRAATGPHDAPHLLDTLRAVAAERRGTDPEGAKILSSLADAGIGRAGYVLSGAERAFMRFRHPSIAALSA